MKDLYWITRLDAIYDGITFIMVTSGVLCVIFLIHVMVCRMMDETEIPTAFRLSVKKWFKCTAIVFGVFFILRIFVPTTNEGMLIYGVGGTIDWVKSNPTAKNLPDKCIIALDKWADKLAQDSIK